MSQTFVPGLFGYFHMPVFNADHFVHQTKLKAAAVALMSETGKQRVSIAEVEAYLKEAEANVGK